MYLCSLDKPGKPKGPLKVSDVKADQVKLAWQPPEDDGGEPIDHYVIERMDTETGRWVPAGTSKVNIANLKFRCYKKERQKTMSFLVNRVQKQKCLGLRKAKSMNFESEQLMLKENQNHYKLTLLH